MIPQFRDRTLPIWLKAMVFSFTVVAAGYAVFAILVFPIVARQNFSGCGFITDVFGQALARYQSAHGEFPPAATAGNLKEPPLSWRVAILPSFVLGEHEIVSSKYDRHEAWDGPHNATLHKIELGYYHCPADSRPTTDTSYLAVTGPGTAFPGAQSVRLSDLKRGADNTILIVETTASGIHWMQPKDMPIENAAHGFGAKPGPSISSRHFTRGGSSTDGAYVVYADGSSRFLSAKTDPRVLRQLLEIDGPKPPPNK
jgi:hypothetical protein